MTDSLACGQQIDEAVDQERLEGQRRKKKAVSKIAKELTSKALLNLKNAKEIAKRNLKLATKKAIRQTEKTEK